MSSTPPAADARPSWLFALLAGAASFLGVPFGFLAFVVLARSGRGEDDLYGSPVSNAWAEGGWTMYLVLGLTVVGALIGAVLLTAAARASAGLAVGVPLFASLPVLAGAAGVKWGLDESVAAVAHAAPADRMSILIGSAGEALQNQIFGASMSGGLAFASGLGLLVASFARVKDVEPAGRHALRAGALVAFVLSVAAVLGAIASHDLAGGCKAFAHAGPAFALELVQQMVAELGSAESVRRGGLVAALVSVFLGAGLMRAPVAGRVAFTVAALMGLALLGLSTRPNVPVDFKALFSSDGNEPALLAFDAPVQRVEGLRIGDDSPEATAEQVQEAYARFSDLRRYGGDDGAVFGLSLGRQVTGEVLAAALEALWQGGASEAVLLTEATQPPVSNLPPPFDAIRPPHRGVVVELAAKSDRCSDEPCDFAQLVAGSLTVGDEKWPLEERLEQEPKGREPAVLLPLEARPPLELLRVAVTAMKHERKLALISSHERKQAQPDVPPEADPEREPAAKAELSTLSVVGSLDPKAARAELSDALTSLARCVEADDLRRLPLTAKAELAVNSEGRVVAAEVEGKVDDGLLDCLRYELPSNVAFSPPRQRGLSLVRVGLKLSAAPKKK